MKKIMLLIFLVVLMASSCSKDKTEDDITTITIWHDKEDAVIEILERYTSSLKPAIEVVYEKKSSLTESLKMVGNDKRSAPDLYLFAHDKIGVYAQMGILAPITDFLSSEKLMQNIPLTVEGGSYKGVQYQMPLYFETLLFMFNRKYMHEDDVPSTTDELYAYTSC